MLLRLLPQPTSANPSPLTILFTLPLPTHPYTSRSLPLPPALLAHKALCIQEDLECPNVLMGEKSSWICGIIDDVTFSLPNASITINFIDGSSTVLPISISCQAQLHRVVEEVQLSFTAPTTVPSSPRSSISSVASTSSTSSSLSRTPSNPATPRRTPSSLLLSLLSPLLSGNSQVAPTRPSLAAPPCAPARVHRRAARSLLVDTYRRHVLPLLKTQLPGSYFPWAIASETSKQMEEFTRVQSEINGIIDNCGISREDLQRRVSTSTSIARSRSASSSSMESLSDDESDNDNIPSPVTPATSVFSSSTCATPFRRSSSSSSATSPKSFLLSIPPAHFLPGQYRMAYATQLSRLTKIASRINQIKRLNIRYEREEGKRKWLESLERGRLADRSLRKAFSNGESPLGMTTASTSTKSRLWRSFTSEDLQKEQEQMESQINTHPAMMDCSDSGEEFIEVVSIIDSSDVDAGLSESEEEEGPITPPKTRCNSKDETCSSSSFLGLTNAINDLSLVQRQAQRPVLERKLAVITCSTPSLIVSSLSPTNDDQSVWEDDDEEDDEIISTPISLSPPNLNKKLMSIDILPTKKSLHFSQQPQPQSIDNDDFEAEENNEGWRIYA
ncbi:uncharacterized protein L201_007226 [Kwoniella dendrophila CBS 6074]|uniref:Uncharacterized protein n=1 Tax=Kwoniella dendrophila CBS 6074 TaxID=1295534 RepID=A0AAX4K3Y3_9TREE